MNMEIVAMPQSFNRHPQKYIGDGT